MRIPIIAGNWKMYKTVSEGITFLKEFLLHIHPSHMLEVVIAPPYTLLYSLNRYITERNYSISLSSQDMFWVEEGAYTGAISPLMIKDTGCKYAILGHSERRQYFNDTDEIVNKKIKACFKNNILPILCVGEVLEERESGNTAKVVEKQLSNSLSDIKTEELAHIIIAYEPVWAIGTGKTATPDIAEEVHSYIRKFIHDMSNDHTSQSIRILYGGSVKPDNIAGLMSMPNIDGALVGGASLHAESFAAIVKHAVT